MKSQWNQEYRDPRHGLGEGWNSRSQIESSVKGAESRGMENSMISPISPRIPSDILPDKGNMLLL